MNFYYLSNIQPIMSKKNTMCQSCSMPLKKDPGAGGTEKDGSKSELYCSFCYADGAFLHPEVDTAEKMQAMVKKVMKGKGVPGFLAGMMTWGIPKLSRWKD